MGAGRWSDSDWKSYSKKHIIDKSTYYIYTSKSGSKDLDPKNIKIRESRDSKENPNSNAIIIGLDVTQSMDPVLDSVARTGLNTLVVELYNRKPVSDPHLMLMGVGDVECDNYPLQVTQFEADIRIAEQLKKVFLERGGGGNSYESYILPWYFAAFHTSIDCFEKRGKKGYLFTVGDECPTPKISRNSIKAFLGVDCEKDFTAEELLGIVSKKYEVYHLMVAEGLFFRSYRELVTKKWAKLLGQRALMLKDHKKLPEAIVSTIQVNEGVEKEIIIASWEDKTSSIVREVIKNLTFGKPSDSLVEF